MKKEDTKVDEVKKIEEVKDGEKETKETKETAVDKEKIKKEREKFEKKEEKIKNRNPKKIIIPIIIASVLLLIVGVFSTIFAIININNGNIVSGVKIEGIDVSGLSREQAKSKIELIYKQKMEKDILVKYKEYEINLNTEIMEVTYSIDEAIEKAISVGKNSNIIVNNYDILFALMGKKNVNVEMKINEEKTKKAIEDIQSNLPGSVEEPNYYIEDNKLIITKGKPGLAIEKQKLINKIKEKLNNLNTNKQYIEIPVTEKQPDSIDIEKIHKDVYKEAKDAYYTKEPFTIYPEVEGVDFDIEEAKKILQEDKEEYEIELIITEPQVTIEQIGTEAFPELLSTFSTRYDASLVDRSTNLRIACEKINEKVILPGEIFSYNQTLGERTIAAGYKSAKAYSGGKIVDEIGGGICQISTTLYNAALMADMEIVERRNHQFITSYVEAGRDATVVYGMTDFKFKNTRDYAVQIKASASNGIATISIYGIKEENEYAISFQTNTISTTPFTIKYIDDSSLAAGYEKVSQNGANGVVTETYIIKSLNGKVVSKELISKDTYNPLQKIILRGTNGATKTSTDTKTTETSTKEVTSTPVEENKKEDKTEEKQTTTKEEKTPEVKNSNETSEKANTQNKSINLENKE